MGGLEKIAASCLDNATKCDGLSVEVMNSTGANHTGSTRVEWDGVPPFYHTVPIKASYGIIGCVGMLGNALVIFVISRSPSLRNRLPNRLIRHNSIVDLVCSVLLLGIALTITNERIPLSGTLGEIYCLLWMSRCFLWSFLVTSTYSLLVVTFERYVGVVHPVWHKTCFNKNKVRWILALAWFIGFLTDFPQTMPTSKVINGKCALYVRWPSAGFRKMTGILTFFILYLIPLISLIYCYGHMFLVLRRKVNQVKPISQAAAGSEMPSAPKSPNYLERANSNVRPAISVPASRWSRAKRNVIKALTVVSICFAICWSCNSIYFFMFSLGYPADYASDFYHFTVVAIYFNCCVNPVVYIIKYEEFREAMMVSVFRQQPKSQTGAIQANTKGLGEPVDIANLQTQGPTLSSGVYIGPTSLSVQSKTKEGSIPPTITKRSSLPSVVASLPTKRFSLPYTNVSSLNLNADAVPLEEAGNSGTNSASQDQAAKDQAPTV